MVNIINLTESEKKKKKKKGDQRVRGVSDHLGSYRSMRNKLKNKLWFLFLEKWEIFKVLDQSWYLPYRK